VARPVEVQGSRPLAFEHGRSVGSTLQSWPQEQIIKCQVQYHPDDEPMLRLEQEAQLLGLYQAALASGHELLLEVIPPKDHPSTHPTSSSLSRLHLGRGNESQPASGNRRSTPRSERGVAGLNALPRPSQRPSAAKFAGFCRGPTIFTNSSRLGRNDDGLIAGAGQFPYLSSPGALARRIDISGVS
jgi:hypothetical protein